MRPVLLAGLSFGAGPAGAAAAVEAAGVAVQAYIEDALLAPSSPRLAGDFGWVPRDRDALLGALCAPRDGPVLRLALTTRPPSPWQRGMCTDTAAAGLTDRVIGRRVLLAFGGESPPALTGELLYRALTGFVAGPRRDLVANPALRWRDLDPALPDAPIRVLLPPQDTAEARILTEMVLPAGCLAAGGAELPGGPADRVALCTGLRDDAAVARAGRGGGVSAWLRSAGPASVALVGLDTVVAEPELQRALPLDGVVPRFASLADGTYPATLQVHLLVLQAGAPDAAATAIGALTAESSIGPGGTLARHGLAALPAAERVRLRAE